MAVGSADVGGEVPELATRAGRVAVPIGTLNHLEVSLRGVWAVKDALEGGRILEVGRGAERDAGIAVITGVPRGAVGDAVAGGGVGVGEVGTDHHAVPSDVLHVIVGGARVHTDPPGYVPKLRHVEALMNASKGGILSKERRSGRAHRHTGPGGIVRVVQI